MLRLITFGGLGLLRDGSPIRGPGAQRRRLALLAVLATSKGAAGVSRDRLLEYFWPEQDEEGARRALNQSIYMLRRELDARDLVTGTSELSLDATVVESDIHDFETAIDTGDVHRALAMYSGPFLDGVHIANAPSFDHWLDGQRERLRLRLMRALEQASAAADARGDVLAAARYRRHSLELDPLDSRIALALSTSLVATGDPGGALRCLESHEARLRDEMGIGPVPDVVRVMAALREGRAPPRPPHGEKASRVHAASVPRPSTSAPPVPSSRAKSRLRLTLAVLGVTAVGLGSSMAWRDRSGDAKLDGQSQSVVVLPFGGSGDSALGGLADDAHSVVEATFRSFGGSRVTSSVDAAAAYPTSTQEAGAAAERAGAELFVLGTVAADHGRVYVRASLRSRRHPSDVLASAATEGSPARAHRLFIDLAANLVAPLFGPRASDLLHEATLGTASDEAFDAFIRGEAKFRETSFLEAADAFSDATRMDSTFALAWYRLGVSLDWAGQPVAEVLQAASRARALRARLSPRADLLVEALYSWRRQDPDSAERLYRDVLEQIPEEQEATFFLAEVLFHENPQRGRPIDEARPYFARIAAGDSGDFETWTHLQRLALIRRDSVALDSIEAHMTTIRGRAPTEDWQYYRGLGANDSATVRAVLDVAATQPWHWITNLGVRAFVFAGARRPAVQLVSELSRPGRGEADQTTGHLHLLQMEAARGRLRSADSLTQFLPSVYLMSARAGLALLPWRADSLPARRGAMAELRGIRRRMVTAPCRQAASTDPCPRLATADYLIGEVAWSIGDTGVARAQVDVLDRASTSGPDQAASAELASALRSLIAGLHTVGTDGAPRHSAVWGIDMARARQRYRAAEAFERAHQPAAALRWYDSFEASYLEDAIYAPAGHLRRAILLARQSDRTALQELAMARDEWSDADPELRLWIQAASDSVRTALARSPSTR
jgi:DNA-binding SARP family transcriptional activator